MKQISSLSSLLTPHPLDPYPELELEDVTVPDTPILDAPATPDPVPAAPEPALVLPSPAPLPDITHDSYTTINERNHLESQLDTDPVPGHPDAVYWCNTFVDDTSHEYFYSMVKTTHVTRSINIKDPDVPKPFWAAMRQPEWAAAIKK